MIAIWFYGFFHPAVPLTEHAAPLYKLTITELKTYPFSLTLFSFILILCEAVLINFIVEKNEILDTTSYLPALVYIILMSLQPEMFSLHPIVIANLFMLLAVHRLMQSYRKETAYADAFNAGFFISIAALFYIPSVIFIFLLWFGLVILRPFVWREWIISFIGILLPWIYLVFYYFWNDKLDILEYDALYYTIIAPRKSFNALTFSVVEYFQIVVLLVCAILTAGKLLGDFGKGTVRTRSNLLLLLWFFIFSFATIFLAPEYSISYLSFLSIPFSIFFSSFLLFAKKNWLVEIIFTLLIISVFVNQFFSP
jgi:hypothetical protein